MDLAGGWRPRKPARRRLHKSPRFLFFDCFLVGVWNNQTLVGDLPKRRVDAATCDTISKPHRREPDAERVRLLRLDAYRLVAPALSGRELFPAAETYPSSTGKPFASAAPLRRRPSCGPFAAGKWRSFAPPAAHGRTGAGRRIRALLAQWQSLRAIRERPEVRALHGACTGSSTGESAGLRNRRLKVQTLPGACATVVVVSTGVALVAQLAELPPLKRRVAGSTPAGCMESKAEGRRQKVGTRSSTGQSRRPTPGGLQVRVLPGACGEGRRKRS